MTTYTPFFSKVLLCLIGFMLLGFTLNAQSLAPLTVEKIMRDAKWMGTQPSNVHWSPEGNNVYFNWNPDQAESDSLYTISLTNREPTLVTLSSQVNMPPFKGISYNSTGTQLVYARYGNLFLYNVGQGTTQQLTYTQIKELAPVFTANDSSIVYRSGTDLYTIDLSSGVIQQITHFTNQVSTPAMPSAAAKWLKQDQLMFDVIAEKQRQDSLTQVMNAKFSPPPLLPIYMQGGTLLKASLSPNERFVVFKLVFGADNQQTKLPEYVTSTGYTAVNQSRTKVGDAQLSTKMGIYDRQRDTVYYVNTSVLPGIKDAPAFYKIYDRPANGKDREVHVFGPHFSNNDQKALLDIRSTDNKDRWIVLLDLPSNSLQVLDRQQDDAWVEGPGIGWSVFANGSVLGWMPDFTHAYFQSENSGFSHLTIANVNTGKLTDLTPGNYEVYTPFVGPNKQYWYFTANKEHPGVRHFYRMPLGTAPQDMEQLTSMVGNSQVSLSPNGQWMAIRYSKANQPWELYLKENVPGAVAQQITNGASAEFKSYNWRMPEIVTIPTSDGEQVYARLYKPQTAVANGPAVIYVHGAGYLQNAHKWWSNIFRDYMFHNLLADNGYTVLDIDYRGSAGYGRKWRTDVYRHLGGRDLDDCKQAAKWLAQAHNVNETKIGIYGGSYGGFLTLMGLFKAPEVFSAGAALRAVSDWAHYNHPYTANRLNTPVLDTDAYRRSSPIYFAEGLGSPLLLCHGVADDNVHFQDAIRLIQRLIELGKQNWDVALYPVEGHDFVVPSSWIDEYLRIQGFFDRYLKAGP